MNEKEKELIERFREKFVIIRTHDDEVIKLWNKTESSTKTIDNLEAFLLEEVRTAVAEREKEIEKKWIENDIGGIPTTDEYANGWNKARKASSKRFLQAIKGQKEEKK